MLIFFIRIRDLAEKVIDKRRTTYEEPTDYHPYLNSTIPLHPKVDKDAEMLLVWFPPVQICLDDYGSDFLRCAPGEAQCGLYSHGDWSLLTVDDKYYGMHF
jgi:hypothetical protein